MLIRCINDDFNERLALNKIYKVESENEAYYRIKVIDDDGEEYIDGWLKFKFEVVDELRAGDIVTIRSDLNVGMDVVVSEMVDYAGKDIIIRDFKFNEHHNCNNYYDTKTKFFWLPNNFSQICIDEIIKPKVIDVDIFESFNK